MAVKTKAKGKKTVSGKVKTARKKRDTAKTMKAEKAATKTEAKKTMSLPKINLSNTAQIMYMIMIIIFLAFVILKYHEII